jgi:hypothetical protein
VAVDSSGNVYISDGNNLDVEKVTPGGTLSIFAGVPGARGNAQSGVAATSLHFYYPDAVAVDPTGDVYIADLANNVIDEVNTSGINTIVAGQNQRGGTPSAGPATSTNIAPTGLAVDGSGNFYISDARGKVLKVTAGTLSIYPGTSFSSPAGLAVDSTGDLYVADSGHNEVAMVNTSGAVSVAVGTGERGRRRQLGHALHRRHQQQRYRPCRHAVGRGPCLHGRLPGNLSDGGDPVQLHLHRLGSPGAHLRGGLGSAAGRVEPERCHRGPVRNADLLGHVHRQRHEHGHLGQHADHHHLGDRPHSADHHDNLTADHDHTHSLPGSSEPPGDDGRGWERRLDPGRRWLLAALE